MQKKKLIVVEGVDRIGKSSVAIPMLNSYFEKYFTVRILNDKETLQKYAAAVDGLERPEWLKDRNLNDLITFMSSWYLFNYAEEVLIVDRLHLSSMAYQIVKRRIEKYPISVIKFKTYDQYFQTCKYFHELLNRVFDLTTMIFVWANEDHCIQDDQISIEESKMLNETFKDIVKNTSMRVDKNVILFELVLKDNGQSDISEALSEWLQNNNLK